MPEHFCLTWPFKQLHHTFSFFSRITIFQFNPTGILRKSAMYTFTIEIPWIFWFFNPNTSIFLFNDATESQISVSFIDRVIVVSVISSQSSWPFLKCHMKALICLRASQGCQIAKGWHSGPTHCSQATSFWVVKFSILERVTKDVYETILENISQQKESSW